MFSRLSSVTIVVIALAAMLIAACGGGDGAPTPTPTRDPVDIPVGAISADEAAYFDELASVMTTISPRFTELDEALPKVLDQELNENARLISIRVHAALYTDVADDGFRDLRAIVAPESLADLQAALIDAFDALAEFGVILIFETDTDAGLNERDYRKDFDDLGGNGFEHDVRAACEDLQIYANGKEAAAVITCPAPNSLPAD